MSKPYPILVPKTVVRPGLDFLVLELPPRYMPMLPNGLGYLELILERIPGLAFQLCDLSIGLYHDFHRRVREGMAEEIKGPEQTLTGDPWDNTNTHLWHEDFVIDHFWPVFEELLGQIAARPPKFIGFSLNGNNRAFTRRFVKLLRQRLPGLPVLVGGYDCVYAKVAPHLFSDFDHMVIGEAEESLGPLLTALLRGETPADLPGVLSKADSPDRVYTPGPLPQDLDANGFPHYGFTDLSWYFNHNGAHLIPISGSRGCRWGRCRFCAECFAFRHRKPAAIVDEMEFMLANGFSIFHFNESDVNGSIENLAAVCQEVLRRGLKVKLVGQLRVDRHNTPEYMRLLAGAGFVHLRFGVDGWSDSLLRLQRKGYNIKTALENIRAGKAAGINITANMVLGVPGETEADIDECIENFAAIAADLGMIEGINPLILAAGSEYYLHPENYGIRFRGDREELYRTHPYYIPPDLWYSEEPYIDQEVRLARLKRLVAALNERGVRLGGFAKKIIEELSAGQADIRMPKVAEG